MIINTKEVFFERINQLYHRKTPFFFLTDYGCEHLEIIELEDLVAGEIAIHSPDYQFPLPAKDLTNRVGIYTDTPKVEDLCWNKSPVAFNVYNQAFQKVQHQIKEGNTYLTNLTFSTPVSTNYHLKDLYNIGVGKYKLLYRDQFLHFSPEPFIKIEAGKIFSFPMKGTLDADLPEAAHTLLEDRKEKAEQFTIVDLIRNDLSQVATQVRVEAFRYLERLNTNQKNLYTISSKIEGNLRPGFMDCPGDVLAAMLPAGSICGAPKQSTLNIIAATEMHKRGFYTGVWGIFDGQKLDSCVIIRYLERSTTISASDENNVYLFKSGGGITSMSDAQSEYQEMIDKVYVPLY